MQCDVECAPDPELSPLKLCSNAWLVCTWALATVLPPAVAEKLDTCNIALLLEISPVISSVLLCACARVRPAAHVRPRGGAGRLELYNDPIC